MAVVGSLGWRGPVRVGRPGDRVAARVEALRKLEQRVRSLFAD